MIRKAQIKELDEIFAIYRLCDESMQASGFTYWIDYPKKHQTKTDIKNESLYVYASAEKLKAVITLDEQQFYPWSRVEWLDSNGKILAVHRLAVLPDDQGSGIAGLLMKFADDYAKQNGYTSIRLDASSNNLDVKNFYLNHDYHIRGEVYLPVRDWPFICFEKSLESNSE